MKCLAKTLCVECHKLMYDTVARFYDAIHADEHEDIDFILDVARTQAGAVLDLGCGTGRITLPLAQAGFTVTGLDNSAEMLTLANKKVVDLQLQSTIQLISADITNFTLDHPPFALALISQNTLMHFTETALPTLLRSAHRHLAPNGLLLIDIANPLQLADVPDQPDFTFEKMLQHPDGTEIRQYTRWTNDTAHRCLTVEWRYDSAENTEAVKTQYHYPYPHTLQMLMQHSNFHWQHVYGDYNRTLFNEESDRLIILATQTAFP